MAAWLLVLCALLFASGRGIAADGPALIEAQEKAVCVLNFAKYVDWPADSFESTNSPIQIGIFGEGQFADGLKEAAEGKIIEGRKIEVVQLSGGEAYDQCQIIFISASEKKRQSEILNQIKNLPVLTVGETDQFARHGGVIGLLKKDGKIRFEVDLGAARQANLQISSKLLSLAETVRGKP